MSGNLEEHKAAFDRLRGRNATLKDWFDAGYEAGMEAGGELGTVRYAPSVIDREKLDRWLEAKRIERVAVYDPDRDHYVTGLMDAYHCTLQAIDCGEFDIETVEEKIPGKPYVYDTFGT